MKNLSLVFAILLVVLWVTNTEGCRRRRKPPPSSPSCGFTCWTTCGVRCSWPGKGCKPYCRRQCGYRCRGKREIRNNNMIERPLSPDFNFYDQNNDSKITLKEFANAINSSEENCRKFFRMGDKDDNKFIDKIEFAVVPWVRDSDKFDLHLKSDEELKKFLEVARQQEELERGPVEPDQSPDSDTDSPKTEGSGEDPENN